MKSVYLIIAIVCFATVARSQEDEDGDEKPRGWWANFKGKVKTVLSKWKSDIKELWDEVLVKAEDMRGWSQDMFQSFKAKMKEWIDARPEVPEEEKNEIENFINKLRVPTEKPSEKSKRIDP